MFIPDPDLDFLPIPDPGVKKAPNPGSGSTMVNNTHYLRLLGFLSMTQVPIKKERTGKSSHDAVGP
jgi:hypothetical protein